MFFPIFKQSSNSQSSKMWDGCTVPSTTLQNKKRRQTNVETFIKLKAGFHVITAIATTKVERSLRLQVSI